MRGLLLCITVLIFTSLDAQVSLKTWQDIDRNISNKFLLLEQDSILSVIEKESLANGEVLDWARALQYRIAIKDATLSDSLFFKNSFIIDSLLQTSLTKPQESVLYLLAAKRISQFRSTSRRFDRMVYRSNSRLAHYAQMSNLQLDSLKIQWVEKSLENANEVKGNREQLVWMAAFPNDLIYTPQFVDILFQHLYHFKKGLPISELNIEKIVSLFSLPSSAQIASNLLVTTDTALLKIPIIQTVRDWVNFQRDNPNVSDFLVAQARDYFQRVYFIPIKQFDYSEHLLKTIESARSQYEKMFAIKVLASKYYLDAQKYVDLSWNYRNNANLIFDSSQIEKARNLVALYQDNKKELASFPIYDQIIKELVSSQQKPWYDFSIKGKVGTEQSILTKLFHQNIDSFHYRIIKVSFDEFNKIEKDSLLLKQLLKREGKDSLIVLPQAAKDYNAHLSYINLGRLPLGNYLVLTSNKEMNGNVEQVPSYAKFTVSNFQWLNDDRKYFLLDANKGKPISNVKVEAFYINQKNKEKRIAHFRTKDFGEFLLPNKEIDYLNLINQGDTLRVSVDQEYFSSVENAYDKEEYDNLSDFYEENAEAFIYTDRAIYRPGQKVFYKIIFYTRDKRTGEKILMTKKSMGNILFWNLLKRWLKSSEPMIYIDDPFGQTMQEIPLKLDAYGSFTGEYTIPKTANTGEWIIEPDIVDKANWSMGSFKVEEYKRPTYELTLEKNANQSPMTDSIIYTVKAKAFSGSLLDNLRLNIHVSIGEQIFYKSFTNRYSNYKSIDWIDTVQFTNEKGEYRLAIPIKSFAMNDSIDSWNQNYTISINGLDLNGESSVSSASFSFSSKPFMIKIEQQKVWDISKENSIAISTSHSLTNQSAGFVKLSLYKIKEEGLYDSKESIARPDIPLFSEELFTSIFSNYRFKSSSLERDSLIKEWILTESEYSKWTLPSAILARGEYKLKLSVEEGGICLGEKESEFIVFDSQKLTAPDNRQPFLNVQLEKDQVTILVGTNEPVFSVLKIRYQTKENVSKGKVVYFPFDTNAQLKKFTWKIPSDLSGYVYFDYGFVVEDKLQTKQATFYINEKVSTQPSIFFERFRSDLQPGSKESFLLKVATVNPKDIPVLMTTMYDATLDLLEDHKWNFDVKENRYLRNSFWSSLNFNSWNNAVYRHTQNRDKLTSNSTRGYWISSLLPSEWTYNNFNITDNSFVNVLMGRVPGVDIIGDFEEVVVTGVGISRGYAGASTSVVLRGSNSITAGNEPLIIVDGVPMVNGYFSQIVQTEIENMQVLNGVEATNLYGNRAQNGVVIITTKNGRATQEEPVKPNRKNFNELAFFYPAIHADKKGIYTISFTMPESVTEWNWKILAHDKKGRMAYAEQKVKTQLPLMVQPNLPRFLYEGDSALMKVRVSNLDSIAISGTLKVELEDLITGEMLPNTWLTNGEQYFDLLGLQQKVLDFSLTIPADFMNPINIKVRGITPLLSDGEEHVLMIHSRKQWMERVVPFEMKEASQTVSIPSIPAQDKLWGLGIQLEEAPQRQLLNGLKYLVNYVYDCSEQLTNKILGNIIVAEWMRKDSSLQTMFTASKSSWQNIMEQSSTPAITIYQSSPWLSLKEREKIELEANYLLLDTLKRKEEIHSNWNKLMKLQLPSGGMAWFEGGKESDFITLQVLKSWGFIEQQYPHYSFTYFKPNEIDKFIKSLLKYTDAKIYKVDSSLLLIDQIEWLAARASFHSKYPIADSIRIKIVPLLQEMELSKISMTLAQLSDLGILYASLLPNHPNLSLLHKLLLERAETDEKGLRWKEIADMDIWNNNEFSLLNSIARFLVNGKFASANSSLEDVLKWMQRTNSFNLHRNTIEVSNMVQLQKSVTINNSFRAATLSAQIADTSVYITNAPLLNQSQATVAISHLPSSIQLTSQSKETLKGSVLIYSFGEPESVSNDHLQMEKKWWVYDEGVKEWRLLGNRETIKLGSKLKVEIHLAVNKPLEFIAIEEKRAAGFEPSQALSGYKYSSIAYYESIRDMVSQFFINYLPIGKHVIEYEMKATHQGEFYNGSAFLYNMYNPQVNTYSNARNFVIN